MACLNLYKNLVKLWLPPILISFGYMVVKRVSEFKNRRFLRKNERFKNLYVGKRCFIVGNSSSIKNYNLKKLAGEKVFSVSNGYLHSDYNVYKPEFHCVPQLTYSDDEGGMNAETASRWITEITRNTGNAILFFHEKIRRVRLSKDVLSGREVSWIATSGAAENDRDIDLARCIFSIQSVPQMAISIAIYMGFKEIYLIGVDHNDLCQNKYEYFFDRKLMSFKDQFVDENNKLKDDLTTRMGVYYKLFLGYKRIARISKFNNCNIFNCSSSSFLDVYPYVPYENIFDH